MPRKKKIAAYADPAPVAPLETITDETGVVGAKVDPAAHEIKGLENVEALRQKLQAKVAVEETDGALTLDEALDVTPIKIRGRWYYILEPSVKEERFLREYIKDLVTGDALQGADPNRRLVETLRPFICTYNPAIRDVEPVSFEEAESILGRKSTVRVIKTLFSELNASHELQDAGGPK